jgi:mRNA-degrading endonuclease toxin of MazEF toxin-antitoxin module
MADKIAAVRRPKLGKLLGELDAEDMVRLERALQVFLRITGPASPRVAA